MDEKIKAELRERGIAVENFDEKQLLGFAKQLKIKGTRKVEIVDYTNKRGSTNKFVRTEPVEVPGKDADHPSQTMPLMIRVEALDQVIADLMVAKGLLNK